MVFVFIHDKDLLWVLDKKAENVVNSMLIKARSISVMTNYFTVKNNVIAFLTHIEEFVEASIKSEDLQSEILTESVKPSIRKIFLANLCQIYLCIGKIKKALHCYNSIKNNKEFDDIRTDIDPGLNVLGLAIFYEINSLDNIECLIRSYKRKSDFMFQNKIYIAIINFFSDICKETEDKKIKLLFEEIIIKVNNIDKKDSKSIFFLENTLISAWLRKKIDEFK